MFLKWKPGQTFKDYGLEALATAAGFRAPSYFKAAKCFQEVVDEVEGDVGVSAVQGAQLAVIGGYGYWGPVLAPVTTVLRKRARKSGFAKEQWWLTRIAVERGRARWQLAKLNKIKPLCKAKFGKEGWGEPGLRHVNWVERCCVPWFGPLG